MLLVGLALVVIAPWALAAAPGRTTVSLAGQWRFEIDRQDVGVAQGWFARKLTGHVRLPGDLTEQGIGDDVTVETKWIGDIVDQSFFTAPEYEEYRKPGNVKIPFWLQPTKYYAGAAWYQREVEIPADWKGKRVVLNLERAHWETRVWVDGQSHGSNTALATPHEYDLGTAITPGKHTLTIRVDNRLIVDGGVNSHSISDHTQGNWNGIVGEIELRASRPVWVYDVQVYPQVKTKMITVKGVIGNQTGQGGKDKLRIRVIENPPHSLELPVKGMTGRNVLVPVARSENEVSWTASGGTFAVDIELPDKVGQWSEFEPELYEVGVSIGDDGVYTGPVFGLREISTAGTQFLLNGQKTFIRGTLECAIFPKTGHPPTDFDSWHKVISVAKAHGLNNIRFHSWCPPEAAFDAADELGFYLMVECSSWANSSTTIGDGKPVDKWIYEEADRILKAYGNHPSFILMLYGNEPGGDKHKQFLDRWVNHYRAKDPRRLYSSGAGWPELDANQFHVSPGPRIQQWRQGLGSRINSKPPETSSDYRDYIAARKVPVISHEIGQWCVYPNFDEIKKYTGYLKPKNFEIFRDRLKAKGMLDQASQFFLASGKLQTLCYKEDIESALRTPGMGGFQLLDLHDFPGQGTALVGVLDPFWDSKGYVKPGEYSRFCNSTVPLARFTKRIFTQSENLEAEIEAAHFGPEPIPDVSAEWRILDDTGESVTEGSLPPVLLQLDNGVKLGRIEVPLGTLRAPARYRLAVDIGSYENDWDFWVYPDSGMIPVPEGITVTSRFDDKTATVLAQGGRVLLLLPPSEVAPDPKRGKVALGFSSIFWNTAWTSRQAPHTLGILCDPKHPALARFPTEYHSNWQWWYLVSRAGAMILDGLPSELRPIVQVIDDWFTARRLGLVYEARVGQGKMVVCSIDLESDLAKNPVARQLRESLLSYMGSNRFNPAVELTAGQVRSLFAVKAISASNR